MIVALTLIVINHFLAATWPTIGQFSSIAVLAASCALIFGQWLGTTVKETSEFNQDVYLKSETLNNVKLVIVMSRNTILLKDNIFYIVPTADIVQFRTTAK